MSYSRAMSELVPGTASCARHRDTQSVQLCERCGDLVCDKCWAPTARLCVTCASRDPLHHVVALPWEDGDLGFVTRLFGTLWALLRPWSRGAALARGSVWQAARFALVFSLPLSCVATIIPLTHTLLFTPTLSIQLIGHPSAQDLVRDIVRALMAGPIATLLFLIPTGTGLICGSLFRKPRIWIRTVLYWSWLPPTILLATYVPLWVMPPVRWLSIITTWPLVIVWWIAQGFIARRALSLGWPRTVLTVLLASLGSIFGLGMIEGMFSSLAPPPAQ